MDGGAGLTALGMVCALGNDAETVFERAMAGDVSGMRPRPGVLPDGADSPFGAVRLSARQEAAAGSRCEALLWAAAEQILPEIERARDAFGARRIGVAIGTSNSTMEEFTADPVRIDMAAPALFLKRRLGLGGPAFAVSTACSSGAKALASARRLLEAGVCDAVLAGGADSFSRVVENGFFALESLSQRLTAPLGKDRDGINLGEGAALFLVRRARDGILLRGAGESSDAYHLTAPHPDGLGAELAMRAALADAGLRPDQIDFIHLHGTGTVYNDRMECLAVERVFGPRPPLCCSTKPMTGHTLGAAGAVAAGLCWLMLRGRRGALPHVLAGPCDASLPRLPLPAPGNRCAVGTVLLNAFAFGGSNACLVLQRAGLPGRPRPATLSGNETGE